MIRVRQHKRYKLINKVTKSGIPGVPANFEVYHDEKNGKLYLMTKLRGFEGPGWALFQKQPNGSWKHIHKDNSIRELRNFLFESKSTSTWNLEPWER